MNNRANNQRPYRRAFAVLAALAIVLAFGAGASAFAQTAQTPQTDKKEKEEVKGQESGQQAAIDPQTGKLRQPTPEEAKALADAMNRLYSRSTENLKTSVQADGTMMVVLPEEYMDVMVIKLNPDGSKSLECVTGPKAAEEALKAPKAAIPPVKTEAGKAEAGKAPQKTTQDKSKWEVM